MLQHLQEMNVRECPRCGTSVRFGRDPHECWPTDKNHLRFNLATTPEEQAAISEGIRRIYGISEDVWYRIRKKNITKVTA